MAKEQELLVSPGFVILYSIPFWKSITSYTFPPDIMVLPLSSLTFNFPLFHSLLNSCNNLTSHEVALPYQLLLYLLPVIPILTIHLLFILTYLATLTLEVVITIAPLGTCQRICRLGCLISGITGYAAWRYSRRPGCHWHALSKCCGKHFSQREERITSRAMPRSRCTHTTPEW